MQHSSLSPMGFLEAEGKVYGETHQCCHCGGHFMISPGSGKVRGFCVKCGSVTCGAHQCDPCLPTEMWIDNVEAGRPLDFRRIQSALPSNPLAGLRDVK